MTGRDTARRIPKPEFQREVEMELTGEGGELAQLIYFKIARSQIPIINQSTESTTL